MILKDLLRGVAVLAVEGDEATEIGGLAYASKEVKPGDLFAALRGAKADGFDFAPEAVARGAAAVLSDRPRPEGIAATWIRVADPREGLALCAANFYGQPSHKMTLVGITGTKGKTTTTFILEAILQKAGFRTGVIGTISHRGPDFEFAAQRTTPEAPDLQRMLKDMLDRGVTHCLMEVSSHSLDLKRVWGISFDVAVFTNLSGEHLDYHRTMEDYFAAKKKLFVLNSKKRIAVVNGDDPWGQRLVPDLPMTAITFGLTPATLVRAERFRLNGTGIEALVKFPGGQISIASPLSGRHNLYNLLAAFSVALALGIAPAAIRDGIAALKQVPGRFEKIENDRGLHIYVDYAHTDSSLRSLLETVKDLKPARILLVFGCGGDRDRSKRARMGEVAGRLADWTIVTSDNPRSEDPMAIIREIERGLLASGTKKYSLVPDRREAIREALAFARKDDYVLVAGKGHESYQELAGGLVVPFADAAVMREILAETPRS